MNRLMAFRAYYKGFPSALPHSENPRRTALQILELLDLVNLQISAIFSAQFTSVPFHALFQGIGFQVLGILRQFTYIVEFRRHFFPLIPVPVERRAIHAFSCFICDSEQVIDAVFTLDFMHVRFILARKGFVHAVLHHIAESAYFESVIGNGIVVVQPSDFRVVRCQYFYIALIHQFASVQGNEFIICLVTKQVE